MYNEYIRSILGYPPMNTLNNNYEDYRNQNMNINYNSTSDIDLESCYPEIYRIVYPMITKKCDNVRMPITNDDIENMTDEIYYALEERDNTQLNLNMSSEVRSSKTPVSNANVASKKVDVKSIKSSEEKRETRQINRNLRDLIQILLIRELLRRRRRPGRPPMPPRPPMPGPRPPMRPPFGTEGPQFNRQFETSNYDIFEY